MTDILEALNKYKLKKWGFVFVCCTYVNEEEWEAFMTEIKTRTLSQLQKYTTPPVTVAALLEGITFTTIEDRKELDNATIQEASHRFQKWAETEGLQEIGQGEAGETILHIFPRYTLYAYVDAEAVESVVNPTRAKERNGYFVTLVRHEVNLQPEDGDYKEEDFPDPDQDESRMRVHVDHLTSSFENYLEIDDWYIGWTAPPGVYGDWFK